MPRTCAECVPEEPVKAVQLDTDVGRYADVCRAVLAGETKDALARWWLDLCEARVLAFLVARGFRPAALPYNYLDVPPRSLAAVADNLRLPSPHPHPPSLLRLLLLPTHSIIRLSVCPQNSSTTCWRTACARSVPRSWRR